MDESHMLSALDLARYNDMLEEFEPEEILLWAWERFGGLVAASSSFQTQSLPLLHMISRAIPAMPVLFLDTGFHFPETLQFKNQIAQDFGLNVRVVRPLTSRTELFRRLGKEPYRQNANLCCYLNKVQPMERASRDYLALISGIRRDQTPLRAQMNILEGDDSGPLRIHPMLNWTSRKQEAYRRKHQLPRHPLAERGYVSIGCAPCTDPIRPGQNERDGRWSWSEKTECGLHTVRSSIRVRS